MASVKIGKRFWGKNGDWRSDWWEVILVFGRKTKVRGVGKMFQSVKTCEKFGKKQKKELNDVGISVRRCCKV
jgi:hypothetical protein